MNGSNILIGFVTIKQHQKDVFGLAQHKRAEHKKLNFLAVNTIIEQHQKEILRNTKGQYVKETNFLVGNATIEKHQKLNLLNTKGP